MESVLLAAGVDDLISWAVILLLFIIPAIGQLLAKMRQAQPPAGGPRPPRPVPLDVADEIEVFMRRVAGRRGGVEEQPVPAKAPVVVERPLEAEVVAEAPVGGQVDEHVQQYLDSREFARRAGQLGEEVAMADDQFDQHLHQAFDHKLGQFGTAAVEATPPPPAVEPAADLFGATAVEIPPTFAAGLAAMLTSADSLRQAIVLSEIIHRPEERWA